MDVFVIRVRYRQGVVGETQRVVHVARKAPQEGLIRTLCGAQLNASDAEIYDDGGMPCMQCTARASLGWIDL